MTANERALRDLVDRDLPSPTYMEFAAARDRVLDELRATPPHLQTVRVPPLPSAAPRWRTGASLAAAAVVILAVATARWSGNDVIRAGDAGRMLTLDDASQVEMRAQSELSIERAADGIGIRLLAGDIIVNAAKQRGGHLYVHTKDMTIAVVGTVFLVNAGADGSRVAVIEGEVRVREGDVETRLRPGEQVATSPTIARRPVTEAITWSRNADAHLAILDSFMRGMEQTAGPLTPVAQQGVAPAAGVPEFEEASIRECDPDNLPPTPQGARGGGANSFQMTPGRLYALCMTPATLIRTAYGFAATSPGSGSLESRRTAPWRVDIVYGLGAENGIRVRGGPDWARNERYSIEAVAGSASDPDTMARTMLRSLLERRFKLKVHVETEQIPAFALVLAPGGLKIKEGTCTPPDASFVPPQGGAITSTAEMVRRNLDAARRGATTASPCGFYGAVNGPNRLFVGAGAGLPALGGFLGAPVIDRTGIPAATRFNYVLEFKPDDSTPGPMGRFPLDGPGQIASDPSAVPPAPNLFTVLEQQFGLRLEPAQAPREFIVIDAIERPSAN